MNIIVLSEFQIKHVNPTTPYIVISISSPNSTKVSIPSNTYLKNVLYLSFYDLDKPVQQYQLFTQDYAQQIVKFVKEYINEIDLIICQCEAGISRSAGVAAALAKWLNGNDDIYFKKYIPNNLVYRLLLEEIYTIKV